MRLDGNLSVPTQYHPRSIQGLAEWLHPGLISGIKGNPILDITWILYYTCVDHMCHNMGSPRYLTVAWAPWLMNRCRRASARQQNADFADLAGIAGDVAITASDNSYSIREMSERFRLCQVDWRPVVALDKKRFQEQKVLIGEDESDEEALHS